MTPYSDVIHTLAESNNLRVLNMYDRWVSYTDARNGDLISTDTTHPSVSG
ncbi:hypothetical protein OUO20_12435 [Arthrobacter sp. FX8]|nr:hypothetical protein [Arthrobacter sp. FX8]WAJ31998.1 hypothetical protein OUO20_12435 [Arthrobacter sp. FX8]